jgi:peptidoglycan-associated lipoprotein
MNKILWPVMVALSLSACGTTGPQATVEDRTEPTATTEAPVTPPAATAADTSAASTAVPVDAYAGDPRKDPASPLSTRSIFFDYDSYVVKDEFRSMLEAHAGYLKGKPAARMILQGNADERGSREYNLALGQKRAEAVRKALSVLGVGDAQMEAISFGEEKLRNQGTSEDAHAENRRADVVYADE